MNRFQKLLLGAFLLGFLSLGGSAFSQRKVLQTDQQWIQSYHEGKINDKWTVLLDGGFRWREGFQRSAYIVRGGLGYSISSNLRIAAGLAYMGTYGGQAINRIEWRPYQEVSLKGALGKLTLGQRLRIEERFFKTDLQDLSATSFNFRFRYSFLVGIPIATLSAKNPSRRIIFNVGDEIFLNAGREITHTFFDQNRLILSPTVQWNKSLSISFTYNSQFASTPEPNTYLQSHIAWIQIRHNLEF